MEKKWNLQDIKPSERRRPARAAGRAREERVPAAEPEREYRTEPVAGRSAGKRQKRTGLMLAAGVFLAVAVAGFVLAILTSGAQVTVFPRFREPTVNAVFEAKRQAAASDLPYEILTLEAEGERQVSATGQEDVETQATGVITIYNSSSDSQRLITNTRFQSANGLIFRIRDPAVVPAASDGVPGTAVAEVFADETGAEYNLPAGSRFRVPGLESNQELYNAIYAENQSPLSGGYEGPRFLIEDSELTAMTESLQGELRQALQGRLETERPAGFTLFPSSVVYVYQDLPAEEVGAGQVRLKQKAVLQVPLFKNEDLASFIAAAVVPGYEQEPVRIEDVSALTFEYVSPPPDLAAVDSVSFRLGGRPLLVWTFDAEQLKKDLAGSAQTALNTVLGGYPAIERAAATIRPFWQRSFPEDPSDITVVEQVGEGG